MPIVFEQIDTAIAPERSGEPQSRGSDGEAQATPSNPAELADAIRRELKVLEERRMRILAD